MWCQTLSTGRWRFWWSASSSSLLVGEKGDALSVVILSPRRRISRVIPAKTLDPRAPVELAYIRMTIAPVRKRGRERGVPAMKLGCTESQEILRLGLRMTK
jgi:propanediol utilization protein